jgi:hypothetical protein
LTARAARAPSFESSSRSAFASRAANALRRSEEDRRATSTRNHRTVARCFLRVRRAALVEARWAAARLRAAHRAPPIVAHAASRAKNFRACDARCA